MNLFATWTGILPVRTLPSAPYRHDCGCSGVRVENHNGGLAATVAAAAIDARDVPDSLAAGRGKTDSSNEST